MTDSDSEAPQDKPPLPLVLLAGERQGGSPLAKHFDVPYSVLVPLAGASPIVWALRALREASRARGGYLLAPKLLTDSQANILKPLLEDLALEVLTPEPGPAASVCKALRQTTARPMLVTTADHALLTGAVVDRFVDKARSENADLVVGLVPFATVEAEFPATRRTRLKFRDGHYCGSNLFLVRTPRGDEAVREWQRFETLRKQPWRLAHRLGPTLLLRYLSNTLSLADVSARFKALSGARVAFVMLDTARAAVDVDSLADWELANELLADAGA